MKKNLLFVLILVLCTAGDLYAGSTPAVASWPLIVSAASTAAASTSGQIDAVAETLGGTLILG